MLRVGWTNHLIIFKPVHTSWKRKISCNCMLPALFLPDAWVRSVPFLCVMRMLTSASLGLCFSCAGPGGTQTSLLPVTACLHGKGWQQLWAFPCQGMDLETLCIKRWKFTLQRFIFNFLYWYVWNIPLHCANVCYCDWFNKEADWPRDRQVKVSGRAKLRGHWERGWSLRVASQMGKKHHGSYINEVNEPWGST